MAHTDNPPSSLLPQQFETKIPEGDDKERDVCRTCGFIDYKNPKIVAGTVITHDNQFLLCKRAIEPRKGYWTIPAGYMELNETIEEAAAREAMEEAYADITIDRVLAMYTVPHLGQVQIMFRASLNNPETVKPGIESLDIAFVTWEDIPWQDMAFPTAIWALKHFQQSKDLKSFAPFTNMEAAPKLPSDKD